MTTSDEAFARMEALVRRMAARQEAENLRGGDYLDATDIVKALPEPIGADLLLARQAFADEMLGSLPGSNREAIASGRYDTSREMKLALAAIQYAREQYAVCGQEQPTLFGQCTLAEYDAAVKSGRPIVYPIKVGSRIINEYADYEEARKAGVVMKWPIFIRHTNGTVREYNGTPWMWTPEDTEQSLRAR